MKKFSQKVKKHDSESDWTIDISSSAKSAWDEFPPTIQTNLKNQLRTIAPDACLSSFKRIAQHAKSKSKHLCPMLSFPNRAVNYRLHVYRFQKEQKIVIFWAGNHKDSDKRKRFYRSNNFPRDCDISKCVLSAL